MWVELVLVTVEREGSDRSGILGFLYGDLVRGRDIIGLPIERLIWWAFVLDLAIYSSFFLLVVSVIGYRTRKRG